MKASRPASLLLACAAAGCRGATEIGAPAAAVAVPSCGPADGPAVTIYLAELADGARVPAPPYVRVALWETPAALAGRTLALTDGRDGGAWRHTSATAFEIATRGTVTVSRVGADGAVEGTADLTFPSGTRVRQAFRAAWRPDVERALCG